MRIILKQRSLTIPHMPVRFVLKLSMYPIRFHLCVHHYLQYRIYASPQQTSRYLYICTHLQTFSRVFYLYLCLSICYFLLHCTGKLELYGLKTLVGAEHGGAYLQSQHSGGRGETRSSGLSTSATWLYNKFEASLHCM